MNAIELTRELVAIPSHDSEAAAGDYVEDWLREHTDAAVRRDEAGADEGRGGNVFARKGSGEPTLALVGHHDVVPPDDSQVTDSGEYVIEERDGRIHGRGTADMKGALAAAMVAFAEADPACELVVASFVGEEVGGVGARAAIDDGFGPDYAVVTEGSTGYSGPQTTDVAVAHKGRRGSTITASGEAAHASEVEQGENAIYRATDAVGIVRDLDFPSTEVLGHEMRGSVAVTEVEGGSAMNVLPERCGLTVDERTVPGERAPLSRVEEVPGVEWTVDQDLPPMACGDADFADAVLDAAEAVQEASPEHVVKPHATDAGWLSEAGTDCVICGIAEPGEAHTANESASLAVIERCERIYRRLAESFTG
ncbi:acetylornithine deacetylase [Halorientalis persicus]|uniref:Acetylornithine deacetylase n=1 Tax=Halorientalis persicus TaxID=1367881 RepID=A0A1H8LDQ6_9EURY|nr:M20/M25/M40 family metallo-hydrolase [Halorientalis persicus]SEO03304.1 acetylornithine deacetylase [Halorientalis persicus]